MPVTESQTRLPHLWRKWENAGAVDLKARERRLLLPEVALLDAMVAERLGNQRFHTFTATISSTQQSPGYPDTQVTMRNWNSDGIYRLHSTHLSQNRVGYASWGAVLEEHEEYPEEKKGGYVELAKEVSFHRYVNTDGLAAVDQVRDMITKSIPTPALDLASGAMPDLAGVDFENLKDPSVLNMLQVIQNRIFLGLGGHMFMHIDGWLNDNVQIRFDDESSSNYSQWGFGHILRVIHDPIYRSHEKEGVMLPAINPYYLNLSDRFFPALSYWNGKEDGRYLGSKNLGPDGVIKIYQFLDRVLPLPKPLRPESTSLTT